MSIEIDSSEEIQDKATKFDGFDIPAMEKEEAAKENEEVQLEGT